MMLLIKGKREVGARLLIACVVLCLACIADARAQSIRAQITVISQDPAKVRVDLQLSVATRALSFRNAYGGVLGLGDRIQHLEAVNGPNSVEIKKLAAGEYQAETEFNWLRYEVDVAAPAQPAQMSHVSWLNRDTGGFLMLSDLLPKVVIDPGGVASIRLDVPSDWTIGSNLSEKEGRYITGDPDQGVFLVGPSVRVRGRRVGATNVSFIRSGEWPFSESDALKITEKLVKEYRNATGHVLKNDSVVFLVPFPGEVGPERWSAETRGNAVVLLLGRQASAKRVLGKLGIVLSHELFHLWVPNALEMKGDYDWFFEGFTLYQALRTDLKLRLISFDTYLETIARVYDSYLRSADRDRLSLIEASERRWTTSSALVYDKGMLVAFIYDLMLSNSGDCQLTLNDVYRQLFQRRAAGHEGANETIIKILSELGRTESFGKEYIEGRGPIDLKSILAPYGIQAIPSGAKGTKLRIADNLTKKQRNSLRCLGYRR